MDRRTASTLMAGSLMASWSALGWAQSFPSKPIRVISPFSAGSPGDVVARPVAQRLASLLGQPVTVENRAGAGGSIGSDFVAKSPADGCTLLVGSSSTHVIAPLLNKNLPYRADRDFTPLAMMADSPFVVVVHPSLPVKNLSEFIAYARQPRRAIAYASSGPGTVLHISGELFAAKTQLQLLHVPYKGAVPAATDLMGGQVQVMFDSVTNAAPHVKAGRLRALAILGPERSALLPSIPTAREQGYDGLALPSWAGFFAPAGTPPRTVALLVETLAAIAAEPDMQARLAAAGFVPRFLAKPEFEAEMAAQTRTLAALFRSVDLKLE